MKEEWRDIKGYEGKYQVSSYGRIKSLNYNRTKKEKILNPCLTKKGYLIVDLYKNGRRKPCTVHKLVALHFIPNYDNLPQVNHKDENKSNNRVDNLEWCTSIYNNNYGTRNKRMSEKLKGRKFTKEHKKNLSEALKGRPILEDTKKKMSSSRKGKHHTEDIKKKISEKMKYSKNPKARKVQCITTGRKFNCLKEAGEYYHVNSYTDIGACCRGKLKSAGKHPDTGEKLVWKYLE